MFSFAERLVLFNQYEILKKLDPEKSSLYERHQEVVEKGLESLYEDLGISNTTVSEEAAQEVADILLLFRAIKASSNGISNNIADKTKFVGFGPTQSSGHFSYADFLSKILKFPQEISKSADNRPELQLERYRTMLKRWDEIGRKRELSADQIEHLVA
ncbi:YfbU family protein [Phyllobacterium zundukense]|uniref:YfbU family protein n=1 Tax=Phyllobacterium zundukense TaxID=1867719 RepID=UPI0012FFD6B1|nr:YfbU family protein [Phyllobacterium zundukense]